MANFRMIVGRLRREERTLLRQLSGIRNAISSLEFGTGGSVPRSRKKRTSGRKAGPERSQGRKRRKMSAAARKAVSLRMKKFWAARRKGK
jgi:hypothetical protein